MRIFLKILVFIGLVIGGSSKYANAQYSFSKTPLLQVLEEVNRESEYILLYRESLVKGISITLISSDKNIFELLKKELQLNNLDLLVDEALRQVVIFRSKEPVYKKTHFLKGYIIDNRTGERLPFAALSWEDEGRVTGIAANEAGQFNAKIIATQRFVQIKASYIGYETRVLEFLTEDLRTIMELTIRLQPIVTNTKEVIVTGFRQFTDQSAVQKAVDIAQGAILGEPNTIKSLQQLPSVSLGPALSTGLNIRGSPRDGFQVLLDGITIYNQTHIFGLFDNFNSDAIQTSGLYYGITPAIYQAPVGGTLALLTRTGSINEFRTDLGVSNTSLNATLEGPISKGKASFLISGRTSFLDKLNWFENNELVNWGLDVDRPATYLVPENVTLRTDIVRPVNSSASFGDIHGKLNLEMESGLRFMLSGYYGFDDIVVNAERLFRSFRTGQGGQLEYLPVISENRWDNGKVSGHIQHRIGEYLFSNTAVGWSIFNTHFSKDDFTYTQINPGTGALESFTSNIVIKSILNEVIAREELEWINGNTRMNGGLSYRYFIGEYFEDSFERPSFFKPDNVHKIDFWLHSEVSPVPLLNLSGGVRTHYYSKGNYFSISPRTNIRIMPDAVFSIGGGYSRNFQHINRITFSNVLSSDVWILVDEEQPPSVVDNFTSGLYFRKEHLLAQLEGYWKKYEHLRLHEIDTYSVTSAFNSSPWFSDNSGIGKGLEFMLINNYDYLELSQSLTLSRMEIQNLNINAGKSFLADWNRTWQYTGVLKVRLTKEIESVLTQVYATGNPNKLNVFGLQEREQLGDYYRTDLRVSYTREIEKIDIAASVSFYNLFDVANPWYREFGFGLDESSDSPRFISVPIEVYDLGFQPSFSVSVEF